MSERVNHAMEQTLTELPVGLWLLKGVSDHWTVLYPTEVLNAIREAFDARLFQEKSQHVAALDELDALRKKISGLENRLANAELTAASSEPLGARAASPETEP